MSVIFKEILLFAACKGYAIESSFVSPPNWNSGVCIFSSESRAVSLFVGFKVREAIFVNFLV